MKTRILIVSHAPTHPPISGNSARINAMATSLKAMGHTVHLAYIPMHAIDVKPMRNWWGDGFHQLNYSKPKHVKEKIKSSTPRLIDKLLLNWRYIYGIDDYFDESLLVQLSELQRIHSYTVVMVEYVFMSKALLAFPDDVFKIIDTHDVFTDRHKHFLDAGREPSWFSTTRRQEAKGLRRANVIMAIQDREREYLEKISGIKTVTVGHLLRLEHLYHGGSSRSRLLFVGSSNQVNVESINNFLKDTFPLVRKLLPDARLLLAGKICDHVADGPGIEKLGVVQDLAQAYAQADVVIAPIDFGTGLNIKVIEALGFGMPVVTTTSGAKGIGMHDLVYLVRDTPESFAKAVSSICKDYELAKRLSRSAKAFADSWNQHQILSLSALIDSSSTSIRHGRLV